MVIDMNYWTRVAKNILIFAISLLLIFLLLKLAIFYIPFLIGFIISITIEPIIKKVSKKTKLTRKTSAIIVLLVIFSILLGLIVWGIISVVTESTNLLQGLNEYIEKIYNQIQYFITKLEIELPIQFINLIENSTEQFIIIISEYISNFLTSTLQKATLIPIAFIYVIITILSTYFICTDRFFILDQMEHHFPKLWIKRFGTHLKEIITSLGNYLKAEVILVLISFFIILIGLYIGKFCGLNIEYPLLSAIRNSFCRRPSYIRSRNCNATMGNTFSN